MKRYFLALLLCAVTSGAAQAEQPAPDTLKTLPIERIVVTGTRASSTARNLPMSVGVVGSADLDNRLEQSVLPILVERIPSLMITSRSVMGYGSSSGAAGAMTMRGVESGMLVLIDGHPQFMGIFNHPLTDTYQTLMAERVEVVRGPGSVLYGAQAMGGVINILTRQQRGDGVNTDIRAMYGSYNTLSAEAVNQTRFGRFNSVLSVGYNRSDGHRPNLDFEQFSGYAKVGYDFSSHWKSFADLNLSKTFSSNPGEVTAPILDNDMDILRGIASLSLENSYGRTSGALKLFYNFGDHYIDDGYSEGEEAPRDRFNSTDWMLGITAFQNYRLWDGNLTTLGFDFQRYGGKAWTSYLDGDPDNVISTAYMNDAAAYLNMQQVLADVLTLNAGVRFDHHSVTGNQWIPQFGLSWYAAPNTTLKAIVSKGYRNPNMRELYMWGPKNPDLKPESLMNYELSLDQNLFGRTLSAQLNLFYIKGKNSIVMAPTGEERPRWRYMNTGSLENYGAEIALAYRINPSFGLNANYSYLHMKRPIAASPEHKAFLGADYSLKRWMFSTGIQYVGGLVTQAPDPTDDEVALEKESFVLWNARVTLRATDRLSVFVRGENLLDSRYSMYKGYPMPGATVFGGISLKL